MIQPFPAFFFDWTQIPSHPVRPLEIIGKVSLFTRPGPNVHNAQKAHQLLSVLVKARHQRARSIVYYEERRWDFFWGKARLRLNQQLNYRFRHLWWLPLSQNMYVRVPKEKGFIVIKPDSFSSTNLKVVNILSLERSSGVVVGTGFWTSILSPVFGAGLSQITRFWTNRIPAAVPV